jgi:hypothetical protein
VLPPLVVSWAVFAQVVSFRGPLLWVVVGSAITWVVVGALLSAHRVVPAMLAGMSGTLLLAGAADWAGGTTSGPLARSTLLAAGLVVAALILAFSPVPHLSLAPMLALLCAALALGAAGSAMVWIGAWVIAAACSLVILGPEGPRLLGRPWMVAGVGGNWAPPRIVAAAPAVAMPPPVPAPESVAVAPSAVPPTSGAVNAGDIDVTIAPASVRTVAPPQPGPSSWVIWLVLGICMVALCLLLLAALLLAWSLGRRALAWAHWKLLGRRVSSGPPEARVIGPGRGLGSSWHESGARWRHGRHPMPAPPFDAAG